MSDIRRRLARAIKGRLRRRFEEASLVVEGRGAIPVTRGDTLLGALRDADIEIDHFCGGRCSCGTCRVRVLSGDDALSPVDENEAFVLGPGAMGQGIRLACQARVLGRVKVRPPR